MTLWNSDTCPCYVDLGANIIINKCTIHTKAKQTLQHNNTLNLAFDPLDTPEQQEADIKLAKETYHERIIESRSMIDRFKEFFRIG